MERRPIWASWLILATVAACRIAPANAQLGRPDAGAALRGTQDGHDVAETRRVGLFQHGPKPCQEAAARVPLSELPPADRAKVKHVIERPTIFTLGPSESFTCCPAVYHWLLDHPDHAVAAWRRLGAKCTEIDDRGNGKFGWTDGEGSDVSWSTVYRCAQMRVWYAEGQVRIPGILPLIPVRAVVVLRHSEHTSPAGRDLLQHQTELFLQTDSRAVALIAKLYVAAAPQEAEKYASQLEMFFSALSWYLDQHPERGVRILKGLIPSDTPAWRQLHKRAQSPKKSGSMPPSTLTSLRA
jgi:hypothetical protein